MSLLCQSDHLPAGRKRMTLQPRSHPHPPGPVSLVPLWPHLRFLLHSLCRFSILAHLALPGEGSLGSGSSCPAAFGSAAQTPCACTEFCLYCKNKTNKTTRRKPFLSLASRPALQQILEAGHTSNCRDAEGGHTGSFGDGAELPRIQFSPSHQVPASSRPHSVSGRLKLAKVFKVPGSRVHPSSAHPNSSRGQGGSWEG